MAAWEVFVCVVGISWFLLPVELVIWELLSGHVRAESFGRICRPRFGLGTMFLGIGVFGLLLAIWIVFPLPIAVALSVGVLVGGPLSFFLFDDLFRRRSVSRERLVGKKLAIDTTNMPLHVGQESAAVTAAIQRQAVDKSSVPTAATRRKWWARPWARIRLGRYGIWH